MPYGGLEETVKETCDVLKEEDLGSLQVKYAEGCVDKASRVCRSPAIPCIAVRLTWRTNCLYLDFIKFMPYGRVSDARIVNAWDRLREEGRGSKCVGLSWWEPVAPC